jgi:hypothetical protein
MEFAPYVYERPDEFTELLTLLGDLGYAAQLREGERRMALTRDALEDLCGEGGGVNLVLSAG